MSLTTRLAAFAWVFLVAAPSLAAERPVRVALPDVVAQDPRSREAASLLSSVIAGELVRSGREVLGPRELEQQGVAQAVLTACPSASCSAAAKRLEADYVLVASAARLGRQVGLDLKVIDPAAGKVLAQRTAVTPNDQALPSIAQSTLALLLEGLPARVKVDEPPPPPLAVVAPPVVAEAPALTAPPSRLPAVVTLGAGAAAAVAGTVLVLTSLSFNEEKAQLPFSQAAAARERAQTQLGIGYAVLGAGVVAAGVGTVLLLTQPRAPAVSFVVTPEGAALGVAGRF